MRRSEYESVFQLTTQNVNPVFILGYSGTAGRTVFFRSVGAGGVRRQGPAMWAGDFVSMFILTMTKPVSRIDILLSDRRLPRTVCSGTERTQTQFVVSTRTAVLASDAGTSWSSYG